MELFVHISFYEFILCLVWVCIRRFGLYIDHLSYDIEVNLALV